MATSLRDGPFFIYKRDYKAESLQIERGPASCLHTKTNKQALHGNHQLKIEEECAKGLGGLRTPIDRLPPTMSRMAFQVDRCNIGMSAENVKSLDI